MRSLLLRTPDPLPGESIQGYVLRVSETNGYDSPWHVVRHAGYMPNLLFKASFPVDELAAIVGKDASLLASHAYLSSAASYQLNGHELGRGLGHAPLRLRRPAICTRCIQEKKIASICWGLAAFVACPFHGAYLLRSCGSCKAHLSWFRPGLLKCKCGASFADVEPAKAPPAVVGMMRVLYNKVMHEPMQPDSDAGARMPSEQLACMPLASLLRLISALNRLGTPADGDEPLTSAAEALSDWPNGFHQYLRRMAEVGIASTVKAVGLRKRFQKLYRAVFKGAGRLHDAEFLRDEFVRFGLEEWGEGTVDKRLLRSEPIRARYLSPNALASRLGVMPITVMQWIEKGGIPCKRVDRVRSKRHVVDAAAVDGVNRNSADQIEASEAGKLSGLPVSVLRQLKRTGHYSTSPIANCRKGFWRVDLQSLSTRLLATACMNRSHTGDCNVSSVVTLRRILAFGKLGAPESKGVFLSEVLDGKIVPIGKSGDSMHDLLFDMADIHAFRIRYAIESDCETITVAAAAAMAGCGAHAIAALIDAGYLRHSGAGRAGVIKSSVRAFLANWTPVVKVARDRGTTSSGLLPRVNALRIPLLRIGTRRGQQTLYVSAADATVLRSTARFPARDAV